MKCEKCGKEYEVHEIEKKVRAANGAGDPTLCYTCRMDRRYKHMSDYAFEKMNCVYCGKEIVTANGHLGRPVACMECYRDKFLQQVNAEEMEKE